MKLKLSNDTSENVEVLHEDELTKFDFIKKITDYNIELKNKNIATSNTLNSLLNYYLSLQTFAKISFKFPGRADW